LYRVTSHSTPDGSTTVPEYNAASLLDKLRVGVRGATPGLVIANIDYNARGQRIQCDYANPETNAATTSIAYTYDPRTFRLVELHTTRGAVNLQDLVYT